MQKNTRHKKEYTTSHQKNNFYCSIDRICLVAKLQPGTFNMTTSIFNYSPKPEKLYIRIQNFKTYVKNLQNVTHLPHCANFKSNSRIVKTAEEKFTPGS